MYFDAAKSAEAARRLISSPRKTTAEYQREWRNKNRKRPSLRNIVSVDYPPIVLGTPGNRGHAFRWFRRKVKKLSRVSCYWCGTRIDTQAKNALHIDHIVPVSRGGSDDPANLCASCHSCNSSKNNKHPNNFARQGVLLFSAAGFTETPDVPHDMKRCPKCESVRPRNEFYTYTRSSDGRKYCNSTCIKCQNKSGNPSVHEACYFCGGDAVRRANQHFAVCKREHCRLLAPKVANYLKKKRRRATARTCIVCGRAMRGRLGFAFGYCNKTRCREAATKDSYAANGKRLWCQGDALRWKRYTQTKIANSLNISA